jgi:hypothetical protein
MRAKRFLAVPALAVLALGAVAATSAVEEVEVILTDNQIQAPGEIPAGPTTFVISNQGEAEHGFAIAVAGEQEPLAQLEAKIPAGGSGTLETELAAGSYEVYDPDLRAEGMSLVLTVTGGEPVVPER